MAFLLRQISHSAEGREIIRPSRIDDDLIRIGRDPTCDIRLTDLAVALQHAVIEQISPSKLGVSAQKGLTVEINGRSLNFGQIDLAQGGDVRIASHLLRIKPTPAGSDEVSIDVEKVVEGEYKMTKGDERQFSLVSVMPSKRAGAWVLSIFVLALFLAWPIKAFYDRQNEAPRTVAAGSAVATGMGAAGVQKAAFHPDETWSSGRLSQAHQQLENNCQACHVKPFEAVSDASCKSCHTALHDHAEPFRLARAMPDVTGWDRFQLSVKETFGMEAGRCADCHREHEGPQQMPLTEQRFCSDCHMDLKSKLPDTKLANAGDFETSHPDFRPAVLTQWTGNRPVLQRVALSSDPKEQSNLKFPHDLHLSRTNGVAQMARRLSSEHGFGEQLACKDCHDLTPDGVRFQPVDMEQDCQMCHSLAFDRQGGTLRTLRHGEPAQVVADLRDFYRARPPSPPATLGGMARRVPGDWNQAAARAQFAMAAAPPAQAERAIRAVFSPGGACYDCHVIDAPASGSLAFRVRPVAFPTRYMHKGWFSHKPHENETCVSCHAANGSASATDLLLPSMQSCRECHGGENSTKQVASSCAMCHDFHMDVGQPSMRIRQQVRGKKQDTVIAEKEPRRLQTAAR